MYAKPIFVGRYLLIPSDKVGSSGGSAVAVAANMVPLAFGTETDGSVIGPAQINGVVGIKPTPGLTSRSGVIPTSYTMDTVGTMGRTVADAVAGLSAISGVDPKDALTMVSSRRQEVDYTAFLTNRSALQGAKFGLPIKRCWEFVTGTQREVAETMISLIKEAGAEIHYVDYPCAEERIAENGKWDWLVTFLDELCKTTNIPLKGARWVHKK